MTTTTGTVTLPQGLTAHITGRSVRLSGNTYPNKEKIKASGFTWRDRQWRGGPKALANLTAALDATDCSQATAPTFPPTLEQQAILRAVATGDDVAISAGAGTGKTSTLELIAAAHAARQILLIVFNKTMQQEAAERMPRNVECRTFDSLGYAGAPPAMTAKFQAQRDAAWGTPTAPIRKIAEVGRYLGLDAEDAIEVDVEVTVTIDGQEMTRTERQAVPHARAAAFALGAVENWCTSADPEISAIHVIRGNEGAAQIADAIVPAARRAWEDICSPTGRLRVTNSHLTKMWALTRPDFSRPGSGPHRVPDMILIDEAQDTAPVVERVVFDQGQQTVFVGDSYQAIYAWRGAQDCLAHADVPDERRLPLTQSWRFGPQIAEAGNAFLRMLGAPWEIIGGGKPGRVTDPGGMHRPDAVLCRTNAGMLGEIRDLLTQHAKIAVPTGKRADFDLLCRTVRWLQGSGPVPPRIHDDIAAYGTWAELSKAVVEGEADRKAEKTHELVTETGIEDLEQLVAAIAEIGDPGVSPSAGFIVVTTAHKAKGLQWDRVRIADDFPAPRKNQDGSWWEPGREELKLAYVAVTRARTELDPGGLAWALEDPLK